VGIERGFLANPTIVATSYLPEKDDIYEACGSHHSAGKTGSGSVGFEKAKY
jgi:hypothetical protein